MPKKGKKLKLDGGYRLEGRLAKNKLKKLARHLKKHPADTGQKAVVNYTRKKPLNYFEIISQKALTKKK